MHNILNIFICSGSRCALADFADYKTKFDLKSHNIYRAEVTDFRKNIVGSDHHS